MTRNIEDADKGFTLGDEDPFLKTTCAYSMSSCMLLVIVFFIVLPGILLPYLTRLRVVKDLPRIEDQAQQKRIKGPLLLCQINPQGFERAAPWTYAAIYIPYHLCSYLVLPLVALSDFFSDITNYDTFSGAPAPHHNAELLAMRQRHPHLRILAAIGTFQDASTLLHDIATSRTRCDGFARNLLRWSLFHKLDGILLAGLFPARHPRYRNAMVVLLKKIAALFRHRELLLVIPPESKVLKRPNSGKRLAKLVDLFVLPPQWLGREEALDAVVSSGIPAKQLVVAVRFGGIPYFLNHEESPLGGDDTSFIPFYDICRKRSWKRLHDGEVTLIHKGSSWLMIEDVESLTIQVSRSLKQGVAGVMAWDVSSDDFLGLCGVKNVLLKTVRNVMQAVQLTLPTSDSNIAATPGNLSSVSL